MHLNEMMSISYIKVALIDVAARKREFHDYFAVRLASTVLAIEDEVVPAGPCARTTGRSHGKSSSLSSFTSVDT